MFFGYFATNGLKATLIFHDSLANLLSLSSKLLNLQNLGLRHHNIVNNYLKRSGETLMCQTPVFIKSSLETDSVFYPWLTTKYSKSKILPSSGKILGRLSAFSYCGSYEDGKKKFCGLKNDKPKSSLKSYPQTLSKFDSNELINNLYFTLENLNGYNAWQEFKLNYSLEVCGTLYFNISHCTNIFDD